MHAHKHLGKKSGVYSLTVSGICLENSWHGPREQHRTLSQFNGVYDHVGVRRKVSGHFNLLV